MFSRASASARRECAAERVSRRCGRAGMRGERPTNYKQKVGRYARGDSISEGKGGKFVRSFDTVGVRSGVTLVIRATVHILGAYSILVIV
ncbi:jg7333 [Pararge aegeria aegeria]|uniref:Jg7333 protein n=1 Tax=Pararge aegeria aegeria TaxID=348720 RepID=A0A8S4RG58_9NEOP|nr:jg7333 [Pararge aegeria aegeria]